MTESQKTWLAEHPDFKVWFPHSLVSIMGWTDVGHVTPQGEFVAAELKYAPSMLGAFSLGDTLYAPGSPVMKVGREFMIC